MGEAEQDSSRRRFPRIPAANTVLVTRVEGELLDQLGRTRTVGLGGCGFFSAQPLGIGAVLELMISVRPEVVRAQARVVYEMPRDGGGVDVGVEFLELDDGDRRLLELLVLGTSGPRCGLARTDARPILARAARHAVGPHAEEST